MSFGDGIDWNAEARRAEKDGMPGESANILTRHLVDALENRPTLRAAGPPADLPRRARIADCGCNIGRFYPAVKAVGLDYIGIDQAPEALVIARKRYPGAVFERAMLWDGWPTRTGAVDGAICNAVLQHNTHEEKRLILARIAEAVSIGGAFVMQESTVPVETKTQLRQGDWISLVESFGFQLKALWHPNDEFKILDGYVFRRVKR